MIKRIYGTCDGQDILLNLNQETGLWETTVPARQDGSYTISLWVEDGAGNSIYFCTVLLTYDITRLCARITLLDVGNDWTFQDIRTVLGDICPAIPAKISDISVDVSMAQISSQVIRCDICGR